MLPAPEHFDNANLQLLRQGRLDAALVHDTSEWLQTRIEERPMRWTRHEVAALHFASLYFPMRYALWAERSQPSDLTEALLVELHSAIERAFWRAAIATPRDELEPPEGIIVDLAFGGGRLLPGEATADDRQKWLVNFRDSVLAYRPRYRAHAANNPWPVLALHYVSFFADYALSGELPPSDARRTPSWIGDLEPVVPADIVRVLRSWFSQSIWRGATGLPARGARISVPRAAIELLLLAAGAPPATERRDGDRASRPPDARTDQLRPRGKR